MLLLVIALLWTSAAVATWLVDCALIRRVDRGDLILAVFLWWVVLPLMLWDALSGKWDRYE